MGKKCLNYFLCCLATSTVYFSRNALDCSFWRVSVVFIIKNSSINLCLPNIIQNYSEKIKMIEYLDKMSQKSALWRHKNEWLNIFLGGFFLTSLLISLIFMTSRGRFLRRFVQLHDWVRRKMRKIKSWVLRKFKIETIKLERGWDKNKYDKVHNC